MFTRRAFLQGITFVLPSIAVGKAGWLELTGDAAPIKLPVPDHLPEIAKLLIGVRNRISHPENWCQLAYVDGVKRCLTGALIEELNLREERQIPLEEGNAFRPDFDQNDDRSCFYIILAKKELFPDFGWRDLARWNDDPDTSHDDILRVLDRAIECATSVDVTAEVLEQIEYEIVSLILPTATSS
jgi:hypothetical protein